jgi:hypothetical protein
MPALRALVEALGHATSPPTSRAGTSCSPRGTAESTLADDLEKAIADELGVTCRVVALPREELAGSSRTTRIPTSRTPSACTRSS